MHIRRSRRATARDITAGAERAFTIRRATEADGPRLDDLGALDHGHAPASPALVAELDGALVAALDLRTQRAIADPFAASAEAVELLRLRAAQLVSADAFSSSPEAALQPVAPHWAQGAPHH